MEFHLTAMGCHLPHGIGVTCHMVSHSVNLPPTTEVNTPRLNRSRTGLYSIYSPLRDGRMSWPRWLVIYRDGLLTHRQSPIQVV